MILYDDVPTCTVPQGELFEQVSLRGNGALKKEKHEQEGRKAQQDPPNSVYPIIRVHMKRTECHGT